MKNSQTIVKQDSYYSYLTHEYYPTLEKAEEAEALERICGILVGILKEDDEKELDQYYFRPHEPESPIQS